MGNWVKRAVLLTAFIVPVNLLAEDASFREKDFRCDTAYNTNEKGCKEGSKKHTKGQFNFNLVNPMAYVVERTWLRARLADDKNWTEVRNRSANIQSVDGVSFQFNEQWIAQKLGTDVATLRQKGYHFRPKIKSVGAGAGREDKCKRSEVSYDDDSAKWTWRKEGGSKSYPAEKGHTFVYKASGSVNDVKCAIFLIY